MITVKVVDNNNDGSWTASEIPVNEVEVPDLWPIAMYLCDQGMHSESKAVLDCWHLCHNMKGKLMELPSVGYLK